MSDEHILWQQFAQLYRQFGEQSIMQQLSPAIAQPQQSRSNRADTALEYTVGQGVEHSVAKGHAASTMEIFQDIVSRFSVNGTKSLIDGLRARFSGSPNDSLGTSPSWYPEQYVSASLDKVISVSAVLPVPGYPRSQRYFLTFQEQSRRWQRVIVITMFDTLTDLSAMLQVFNPDNIGSRYKTLPKPLQRPLRKLLQEVKTFDSVTTLSVRLAENGNGEITADLKGVKKVENMLERKMSKEEDILQDIEDLGCRQFKESNVALMARISCYRYKIWMGDRNYVERKVPFASSGLQGDNLYDDFIQEVKRLKNLSDCAGVLQFMGVVLDDTRKHLKSYLCEAPAVQNLRGFIGFANKLSKPIPWAVRELWIRQIISAVSHVHARNLVVGALNMNRVNIRADGTLVLDLGDSAHRHLSTEPDRLPPELRERVTFDTPRIPSSTTMNFKTDIFQLGFAVWLIAEHRPHSWGYYCLRNACTSVPRYQCVADHAKPTELPPCSVGIPSYIDDIIRDTRSPNPKDRPPAKNLVAPFPSNDDESQQFAILTELMEAYVSLPTAFCFFCSECGTLTTDLHYHCYICDAGDFDLCTACFVEQRICCWIPQHRMVTRIIKDGDLVDVSSM
jgi:hypothetical protein